MSNRIILPNRQDFYRFFWLFLVFMLLLAAGLFRWMLQLSALALLIYVLIAFSFQKAFVYQLSISSNQVLLKKCFAGFCYWKKGCAYRHIAVDHLLKTYRFVDSRSHCTLEIQQGTSRLQFIFPKKEVTITDRKAVQTYEKQFLALLEKGEVKNFVVS